MRQLQQDLQLRKIIPTYDFTVLVSDNASLNTGKGNGLKQLIQKQRLKE